VEAGLPILERHRFDVVVVGGGAVGLWAALDLATRGVKTLLLERRIVAGETSNKYHGLLHSGARYAVVDPIAAKECYRENRILSTVVPHVIEDTGGYYVALTESDEKYYEQLAEALRSIGIPFREVPLSEAFREEPHLNREARLVIEVPDKVIYARELAATLAYAAYKNGATIAEGVEVVKIRRGGEGEALITVKDVLTGETVHVGAEVVLNAAGPWAGKIAKLAGINVAVAPTAGAVLVYGKRLTWRVINRMRRPSDGDIIVPYGRFSLAGTTAYPVRDPDAVTVREEDIDVISREAAKLIPVIRETPLIRAYASVRPLLPRGGREARTATRSFDVMVAEQPIRMVTVVGGKLTTARLVAEKAVDAVAKLLNVKAKSKTSELRLNDIDPFEEIEDSKYHNDYVKMFLSAVRDSMDYERLKLTAFFLLEYEAAISGRLKLGLKTPGGKAS
jgi:glycerol-3-phosphate dehydrogenase